MQKIHCVYFFVYLFFFSVVPCQVMSATGNISTTEKYAWSETSGWFNFGADHGGVTVLDTHIRGFVWAANIGWIKLGVDSGGPYGNSSKDDWGVNRDTRGGLSGFGWSETVGWINFHPSHSQVTVDPVTGMFDGYAWAANRGYIHFQTESPVYSVRTTNIDADGDFVLDESDICLGGDDSIDSDGDGVPDFCDPCPLYNPDSLDSDGDGVADCVDPFPHNARYFLDTDNDGMPDIWEVENGLITSFDDADDDADKDGLINLEEFYLGTFANRFDSDGDGLSDLWEAETGLDPLFCLSPEDSEGDFDIDGIDVAQFSRMFAELDAAADMNDDGQVDTLDLLKIAGELGKENVCRDYSGTYCLLSETLSASEVSIIQTANAISFSTSFLGLAGSGYVVHSEMVLTGQTSDFEEISFQLFFNENGHDFSGTMKSSLFDDEEPVWGDRDSCLPE